jgi:hypothetical protein
MSLSYLFRFFVILPVILLYNVAYSQSVAADTTWLHEQSWEKDGTAKKKMLAFEEFMKSFPDGEGEITYFIKGDSTILKINEWSSTEQTIIIRDFYYTDTLLAAVHVKEFTYPKTNGVPDHRHANKVSDYIVIFDLVKGTMRNKVIVASKKGYGSKDEYLKSSALYRMVFVLAQ